MFTAISLILVVCLCLGLICCNLSGVPPTISLQSLGTSLGLGILIFTLIIMASPSFVAGMHASAYLSLMGVLVAGPKYLRKQQKIRLHNLDVAGFLIVLGVLTVLAIRGLSEPISEWDARSIWYFHARMLYLAQKVLDTEMWNHASLQFTHPDYPKLNAILSAGLMKQMGFWNEVAPKFSLFFLHLAALLLAVGYSRDGLVRLLLLGVLVFRMDNQAWNGYMDGFLAMYAGLATIYGGRFAVLGATRDLQACLVATAICCGLKNEGQVLAAIILALCVGCRLIVSRREWRLGSLWRKVVCRQSILPIAAFGSAVLWTVWKSQAGLVNDLVAGASPLTRMQSRWQDAPIFRTIFQSLMPNSQLPYLRILGFFVIFYLFFYAKSWRKHFAFLLIPLGTGGIYFCVLMFVYLSTPRDVLWHLSTSASRTILPVQVMIWISLIGLIQVKTWSQQSPGIR